MKKRIRIQGALVVFALVLSILFSKLMFPRWLRGMGDAILWLSGIYLVFFGFLIRISARGYKEEKSNAGKSLVKDGPYGLIRNPMYFGTLVIGIGVIAALFDLWVFPLFLIVFLAIYLPQVKAEEKVLLERFGQEYKDYCMVTSRYFPNIRNLFNLKRYLSLRMYWIRKELFSLVCVFSAIFAIKIWEGIRLSGRGDIFKKIPEIVLAFLSFVLIMLLFSKKKALQ